MTVKVDFINTGRFTPREAEIAGLIAEGLSDKDIARTLAISIRTVQAHTAAVYEKLELRSKSINTRCTAIITMVARGMIQLSIRSIVAILVFNAALLDDDEALRVRGARHRTHVSRSRRDADA